MIAGKDEFPPWSYSLQVFSRLLMILNCCVNSVIYCCLNAKFRKQVIILKNVVKQKFTPAVTLNTNTEEDFSHASAAEMQPIKEET